MSFGARITNIGLAAAAAAVIVMGTFTLGPWVESHFAPVYSKFEIVSVEADGEHNSRVVFKFTKFRHCEPQGFAWYTGELGGAFRQLSVRVDRGSDATTAPRPLGYQETNPYVIDVTPDRVRQATFAEVYSRCHPFWLTRTIVYP